MKRFLSGVLLLTMFASAFAAQRTIEEAAALAADFSQSRAQKSGMKKAVRVNAKAMSLAYQVAKPTNMFEPALYVFNKPEGGWVIVSADDNAVSILGYSDEGTFNEPTPSVAHMLDHYAEQIALARPLTEEEKMLRAQRKSARKAKAETAVSPLLEIDSIRWNQGTPYNDLCPIDRYDGTRCATGCSATAASQVMRYWKWPAQGRGTSFYTWSNKIDYDESNDHGLATYDTVLTINHGATTYDWNNMLPQYEKGKYNAAQGHAVAVLMNHAGVAGHMTYGGDAAGGSGTFINTMGSGLVNNFRYKFQAYLTRWDNGDLTFDSVAGYFSTDLHAGRPIIMSGGGHAYVCDGMDGNGNFHINWGWGGYLDGYFVLSGLDPDHAGVVGSDDKPIKYSKDLDFVFGLEPDKDPIHVTNIVLDRTTRSLSIGEEKKLQATVTPAEATCKGIYWTSSDEKIVKVKGNILMEEWEHPGKDETKAWRSNITGVSAGTATVYATTYDGELVDSCVVTVSGDGGTGVVSNTMELVFNTVFEKKHSIGDNRVSIGLHGDNQYPYMWFKLAADTLNWRIAGYYELGKNGNKINGWTYADPNHTTTSKSGWVNITCTAEGEYVFKGEFIGDDNLSYKFNDIISISNIYEHDTIPHTLTDQAGDGTLPEVTWNTLGQVYATGCVYEGKITLPVGQPDTCSNGRVFIGWSATEVEATNNKPALVQNGDAVNSTATYYAVYAERPTTSVTPVQIASVKFNHYSGDDDKLSVANAIDSLMAYDKVGFAEINGTNTFIGEKGIKMSASGKNGILTLTLDKPQAIKKVVINAPQVEDNSKCRIRVIANSTMIGQVQAPADNMEYSVGEAVLTNTIKVAICNKRNAYIDAISVFADNNGEYTNYSTSCDGEATDSPIVTPIVNNEGLILTQDSISLDITEIGQLVYTIAPYEYKDQTVTWESADPNIASVDANGIITGVAAGTTTITGTAVDGGQTATCVVIVSDEVFQNRLIFNGKFEQKYDTKDSCFSIGLRGPEGDYYPYLWFRFHGNNTDWKIAGDYELNGQNEIRGWITEAHWRESKTDASVSGWLHITCVEVGKYNFQGQYVSDNGLEYVFDYTTSLSYVNDGEMDHILTDLPDGYAPEFAYFVSMGEVIDSTCIINGKLVMTSTKPADCDNMTFMGWTTEENYNSDIAPGYAKEGDATTANTTYYAVYAILSDNIAELTEVASVVFADIAGSENAASANDVEWYDDAYIGSKNKWDLVESSNNITDLHGYSWRAGEHGTRIGSSSKDEYGHSYDGWIELTMGQSATITKVVTTFSKTRSNDLGVLYVDLGDVHDPNPISAGEDGEYIPSEQVTTNKVKLSTAQKAEYIKSVAIYTGGQRLYKNFTTTTCYDPITTAIENNGAKENSEWTKSIENGVLYIIRDGKKYNVLGLRAK